MCPSDDTILEAYETRIRHLYCQRQRVQSLAKNPTKPTKPNPTQPVSFPFRFAFHHLAAMNGHALLLRWAINIARNAGEDVLKDAAALEATNGMNALALAASKGQYECVEIALDELKININSTSTSKVDWQAIHFAAAAGHDRVVDLLASRGADPNAQTFDGDTPASLAQKGDHGAVISVLKSHGVQVVSQIDEQLRMVADTTKLSSVKLMTFRDEVPSHLQYPSDVRALNAQDSSSGELNRDSQVDSSKRQNGSHVHHSLNAPWRTARLFISSTFEGSSKLGFGSFPLCC